MSLQPFPEIIDVRKYFSRQAHLKASLSLQSFKRLEQYLDKSADDNTEIRVKLNFRQDDEGRFILEGDLQGSLLLSCQRCLQGLDYELVSAFSVEVLDELNDSGDRELAEDELEVVISVDGKLDLLTLVEDELILSLPLVIYHDDSGCNEKLVEFAQSEQEEIGTKPFAELKDLKQQLKLTKGKVKQP